MRSSPSALDALLAGDAGFAHRGLHGAAAPENSMAAFLAAVHADVGIECDLQLSQDEFAMVFHDDDLQRLCGLDALVDLMDAACLMRMPLNGTNERIPWLGDLLAMVCRRVPILLELKFARGRMDKLCQATASTIRRYRGALGVMSFEASAGEWFSIHMPSIPRGLVLDGSDAPWERNSKINRSKCQFVAVNLAAIQDRWVSELRKEGLEILCWTVRTAANRRTAEVHADALIWEGDGRPRI